MMAMTTATTGGMVWGDAMHHQALFPGSVHGALGACPTANDDRGQQTMMRMMTITTRRR